MNKSIKILILLVIMEHLTHAQLPIAFGLVRNIPPSLTYEQFLSKIGKPLFNSTYNLQTGFNLVSLSGFTSTSTLDTLDSQLTPLTLWKKLYEIVMSGKSNTIGTNTSQIQKYIIHDVFHANGSRILMHLDLSDNAVSGAAPVNAKNLANQLVRTVTSLQLDGISIYFGDYNAVAMNTASNWLQVLLNSFRSSPQNKKLTIVLIIPPQFIPLMQLFNSLDINSLVDYFVLKYYGNVQGDYNNYQTLFERATLYSQTSVFELNRKDNIYIDACRTIIAKPSDPQGSINSTEYMNSSALSNAFLQAYKNYGWFAGYANLNMETDPNSTFTDNVLNDIRTECLRSQNCFC